jgi:hypothetical protein
VRRKGVIVVRQRRAEKGHHGIADMLVDGAAVLGDDTIDQRRVAADEVAQLLRIERLR